MAPPRNQRNHGRINSKGGLGWKGSRKGRGKRVEQPHRGRSKGQESNPDNENLYSEVDRFHMQKDLITFDGADAKSEESDDDSEEEEAVMNLKGVNGGGSSGSGSESSEESDDDDSDVSELPELPEHVRRAALGAASSDDDSEDGEGKFAAGWGKNRSSYYDADTADLEIGQEFEEAEAEEEAALEQQRASYKKLDPADFGEEEDEEDDADEDKQGEKKQLVGKKGTGKARKRIGSSARGATLLEMKSDLEQIALGGGEEIMTSMVKKDVAKLTRRDKLERVLSEAPELPSLMAELKAHLRTLTEKVQPLVSNVTADLGASEDGLMYLRTRQQLLLAFCMNVCFYMILKAKGKSAKGHPVIRRLLSLRALLADLSELDDRMSSQVDLLLRALESGVDFTNAAGGDDNSDVDEESGLEDGDSANGDSANGNVENSIVDGRDSERGDMDEEYLEEEEAAFMGNPGEGDNGKSNSSKGDGGEEGALSSGGAVMKRRRLAGMMGDPSFGDFGDEDERGISKAGVGGAGNILQGMVNRISQRERSLTRKHGGLQGDQDVPIRERDQTIRVRRPVPGEDEGDAAGDSDVDDLGLGGDGFLGGIPVELLDGLSRRKPAREEKRGDKKASHDREGNSGADGEEEVNVEEDAFYAAVAEQKERKKRAKKEKYTPERRIAGALEAELEAERAARGETKRGASYTMIKNKGLTPHKNKLNRNPRVKKREAFRKATIRRKGQVREIRTGEADRYGGESTGIKTNVIRSRKLKG